jgi:glyoxylase-like metal-dependent hydrolase (beta-lactamase superfamily II)
MPVKQVFPPLYTLSVGASNAFLLDAEDGLTLIDTGLPGNAEKIVQAVHELGKEPDAIKHILVTHCHTDHAGSLAAIKRLTGALAFMHPLDAKIVRDGLPQRPMKPAPGLLNPLFLRLFGHQEAVEPTTIEQEVPHETILPIAGGIQAFHVPGHCAGQLAFLWRQHGNVLFAADTAANMMGLGLSIGYENLEEGKQSLAQLSTLDFEVACFGHGNPIVHAASQQFKHKWSTSLKESVHA